MNAPTILKDLLPATEQGRDLTHESALLHVTGQATYTDDIPELRGTLYAALVLSPVAHGELIGEGRSTALPCWPGTAWWRCSRRATFPEKTTAARSFTTTLPGRRQGRVPGPACGRGGGAQHAVRPRSRDEGQGQRERAARHPDH